MDLLLAICQAIGIGIAVGIGGPLVALFVSFMASMEAGIDPRGTDWKFIGETWFLVVLLLANVVGFYLSRSGTESARRGFQALVAGGFGAVAGAASLAQEGEPAVLGLILGLLAGVGSALVASDILAGARRRASASRKGSEDAAATAATLELIFAAAGILIAALALFVPPAALLGLVGLGALAAGRRRRAGEKYEGLRVLR
jgi:hypothetical protein